MGVSYIYLVIESMSMGEFFKGAYVIKGVEIVKFFVEILRILGLI